MGAENLRGSTISGSNPASAMASPRRSQAFLVTSKRSLISLWVQERIAHRMNAEKPNGFRRGRAFFTLFLNNPCRFFHLSSDPMPLGPYAAVARQSASQIL